jgi:CheY-like chemotaxis protein
MGVSPNQPKARLAFIVEDEPALSDLFDVIFAENGFATQAIYDGAAALTCLADAIPEVVLLDLHLPYVSGTEVLQHIRQDPRLARTKVILTSADYQLLESLEPQADYVLGKPATLHDLQQLIDNIIACSVVEGAS